MEFRPAFCGFEIDSSGPAGPGDLHAVRIRPSLHALSYRLERRQDRVQNGYGAERSLLSAVVADCWQAGFLIVPVSHSY